MHVRLQKRLGKASIISGICLQQQLSSKHQDFKGLYRRKCRSPICWTKVGDGRLLGPQIIQETTEKFLDTTTNSYRLESSKSYANKRRKDLEFSQGDHVFLKVSPSRGIIYLGIKGKLNPHYIGQFEILERIGLVAYHLVLPSEKGKCSQFSLFRF